MSWPSTIQANIVRGLRAPHARYLFLRSIDDGPPPPGLRRALGATLQVLVAADLVKTAAWQDQQGRGSPLNEPVVNLALTRHGLELLADEAYCSDERVRRAVVLDQQEADAFAARRALRHGAPAEELPTTFANGGLQRSVQNSMYRRRDLLGEAPSPDHEPWLNRWIERPFLALVWITGPSEAHLSDVERRLRAGLAKADPVGLLEIGHRLEGRSPAGDIDHFGFRDGTSQPAYEGVHDEHEILGRGAWTRKGWRGFRAGEIVVGEVGEGSEARAPEPNLYLHHCTYLAFRQIRMWPDRLAALEEKYQAAGPQPPGLAPSLVGRHRPGKGGADPSDLPDADDRSITFHFDSEGLRVPLGSHIRRANPRDSLAKNGNRRNMHSMARRGKPFEVPETGEVGLAFIALQGRLEDGFEFVQSRWLNSGSTLHTGQDPDPIAGVGATDVSRPRMVRQGSPVPTIGLRQTNMAANEQADPGPLTEVVGGEYFVLLTVPRLELLLQKALADAE